MPKRSARLSEDQYVELIKRQKPNQPPVPAKPNPLQAPVPEEQEQADFVTWANDHIAEIPELVLLHAIPNGGYKLTSGSASSLAKTGLKKGVPDMFLPVARGNYHGLYIEFKRMAGGSLSSDQSWWMERLLEQGYQVMLAPSKRSAVAIVLQYLNMGIR